MATHLPSDDIIAEYAGGGATPGVAFLMAAHLAHASESREKVAGLESLGGALLQDTPAEEMPASALDAIFDAIDEPTPKDPRRLDAGPLPQSIVDHLGVDFNDIRWKFRWPGMSVYEFDDFGGEKVTLVRGKPGVAIPQHTHSGLEMTLVLTGCLEDDGVEYRAGDVSVHDEAHDHRPKVGGDETCYCLIVEQGSVRFTGRYSRILNIFDRKRDG
ncbi:MAG: ChrR family anti-sigma-E factor [Pseudomonadota bacterium]